MKSIFSFLQGHHRKVKKPAKQVRQPLFVASALRLSERLVGRLSDSTLRNYHTALHSFSDYLHQGDIPVNVLTSSHICGYADWLAARGVGLNTASCYLRSLRALYNRLARRNRRKEACPFAEVYTDNARTEKRAVPMGDMRRICALQLPEGSDLQLYLDLFLFCFYAMGMPFADAVRLRWTQVRGDYIDYRRQKTGRSVSVRIEPCMRVILQRYRRQSNGYIFPILPISANAHTLTRTYRTALGRYNRALKRIATLAGVRHKLSSYVPRHTWATEAYAHKVEMAVIAQALGHANTRTTWTYVRQTRNGALAVANRKIIGEIRARSSAEEVRNGS